MIGARGYWPYAEDVKWMKDNGLKVFTMVDVDELGIDACVAEALERASRGTEAVYVSFDGDAIDPAYAPGLGAPTPGGLTSREAIRAVRRISRSGAAGMDLVELSPFQDNEAQTSTFLAITLMMETLGGLAWKKMHEK
jgi:agmatinase